MPSKWLQEVMQESKRKLDLQPLLCKIQEKEGFISRENLEFISKEYDIPLSKLYCTVTFFNEFKTEKRGRHVIKVCNGTACSVKHTSINLNYLKAELGLEPGKTTKDGMFTLESVNCLGTCSLAPVVEIDGKIYSMRRVEELAKITQKIKREEMK